MVKITIILVKANWCGFCNKFQPNFEKAKEIIESKNNNFLKDYDIEFETCDYENENEKNIFIMNHNQTIKGYPTVFVKISDEKKNDYIEIKPAFEESKIEAANRFIENIINCIKTNKSDSKVEFKGGSINEFNDKLYRKKYLKYKSKYLKLKNIK